MGIDKNESMGNKSSIIINNLNYILNITTLLSEIDDPEIATIIDFSVSYAVT